MTHLNALLLALGVYTPLLMTAFGLALSALD